MLKILIVRNEMAVFTFETNISRSGYIRNEYLGIHSEIQQGNHMQRHSYFFWYIMIWLVKIGGPYLVLRIKITKLKLFAIFC